ncbi:two-component system sensor histidine kinase KdpD [Metabacillus crassostreae]|uniref:KdpD-like non-kinase potassium sensor n=1 Tax=Metabacillus crassostreae TaxID=929098 RepID=UPI0030840B8E|nr:two-component system sensor histidine kinase KdpD [Metabacillus crassostreae]
MEKDHPYFKRKKPEEILEEINQSTRGKLKLYIGAAPGVGKTYKMLQDALDLRSEGHDVVIGLVETHGRKETIDQIRDLEQIPLKKLLYKEKEFFELNVEEIVRRNPEVVIVDELAHTNIPGSYHHKRYQDVEEILETGINVLSAVNIQHLESVNDIVQHITGVKVRERVPDLFVQKANEIQLIDITPETLRKRLTDGKIYATEKIEQSLSNFFSITNLSSLRELALREVANDVDERIEQSLETFSNGPIGVHEKILVCVHYGPTAEKLIRRGWRMAHRLKADLYILNVISDNSPSTEPAKAQKIKEWSALATQFHAKLIFEEKGNRKPAKVIIDIAKQYHVTQILLGQSARTRWEEIRRGSIVNMIMRETSNIDIQIVADGR